MTNGYARQIRFEIARLRGKHQAIKIQSPGFSSEADYLWQGMQRLCRELEDAGHPTFVEGECD